MNGLQSFASQLWVERFGWTLLHFLWQGLLIAALYEIARRSVAQVFSPHLRYLLACAALTGMLAAPVATWWLMRPFDTSPDAVYRTENVTKAPGPAGITTSIGAALPASVRATAAVVQPAQFLSWVVMIWLAGALVFWVRLAGGWVVAARMRSVMIRPAPPEWQEILRNLAVRMGVSYPVRLLVSALVQAPMVIGWLRPLILAPVGALSGLPREHVEALLLHELAHIRRHDFLVNILQSVAEALLFYHPAVWWVSADIRAERERCCDDVAVEITGDVLTYARALAQLEFCRAPLYSAAIGANGGLLSARIARLLGTSRPASRSGMGPGVFTIAILLVAAAFGLFGQPDARRAFQSVSIKRNTLNWSERSKHPMGMGVNASLLLLIQFTYASHESPHSSPLPPVLVTGGPEWINSEGYDIDVKPAAHADPKQIWTMWQTLLAERFKLRFHRETRELPSYVLTAANNGLKLPPPKEVVCVSFPPGTKPRHVPGKVDCGHIAGPSMGWKAIGLLHMEGRKVRMENFTGLLALILDRPVLNKTGFTGEFDLDLSFAQDETLMGFPEYTGTGGTKLPADPIGPNLSAALEQQLGLKLVPAKSPVELLVIDHAERPTEN